MFTLHHKFWDFMKTFQELGWKQLNFQNDISDDTPDDIQDGDND